MLFCRETGCLGWSLSPSDQFCAWCGTRLVEIAISFESKLGEEWVPLTPPVLNRERPPALRLRIAHEGEAGTFPIQPDQLRCSAPWLGFDTSKLLNARLQAGETIYLPVNRLKVPGKEDTFHDAKIGLSAASSGEASHSMIGSVTLSFVPPPRFVMELETTEVLLSSEGAPSIDGSLLLERGRVWLENPPRLVGDWATLELLDEDPDKPLRFPLELDGREKPRLNFRIRFGAEHVADIRQTGSENPTALRRNNKLVLTCRDRGMRISSTEADGPNQESLKVELPLQLNFILAPEVYLEPFISGLRSDWHVIVGGDDAVPLKLRLSNGALTEAATGSSGRQELIVRQLGLRVRQPGLEKCFSLEIGRPTPWTLAAGESVSFTLRFLSAKAPIDEAGLASSIELVLVTNDPLGRSFFLDFKALRPKPFPGWLVVDLGTSNTCAALVDENRKITLIPFDDSHTGEREAQLASAVCYLRLRRETELELGERAVERSREPSATRAVVLAAKRRVGHPERPYHITPLDEPAETIARTAEAVLQDIYLHVIRRATRLLLSQGRQEIILSRVAITHPSRFSVTQIGHLKRSASAALSEQLKLYPMATQTPAEPQTMHEPVGAALHFLNDWKQQASLFETWARGDEMTYHLFVYDFGGGTLDITLIRVQASRQPLRNPEAAEHGYSYTVSPLVLGAMGERWFGGQDVTRELVDLLRSRLPNSERLIWTTGAESVTGRRNEALLTAWAEELKIAMVAGQPTDELLLSLPSLHFEEDGKEKLVAASSLRRALTLPTLEELQERVRPTLHETLRRAAKLVFRHGLEKPDLVVQVGQSCLLPAVEETLREHFPDALHLRSEAPKSCVVLGAATAVFPGVSAGIQLSRGIDRPGLRLKLPKEQSLSATTSRLGIKVLDGGLAWFQEILGEGVPIPREGLSAELEGIVLQSGPNLVTLLENCGNRDELLVNGVANREIQEIREVHFKLGADGLLGGPEGEAAFEDCQLRLTIDLELSVVIELHLGEKDSHWQEITRLSSQDFGGTY